VLNDMPFPDDGRPLALYGLAGNPPHAGHWACVAELASRGYGVLVAPSFSHAFGKRMAPFELRVRWLAEAGREFEALGPNAWVWDEERRVAEGKGESGVVYSIDMLARAREIFGRAPVLAVGPDNADPAVFGRFHQHERIAAEFGVEFLPELGSSRSTLIRNHLAEGNGCDAKLRLWVGDSIAQSVANHFARSAPSAKVKGP
jgi:nicotinate-nucleotide adenylyltransferase